MTVSNRERTMPRLAGRAGRRRSFLVRVCFLGSVILLVFASPFRTAAESLDSRLQQLETRQAELYHTLQEKKGAGLMTKITERISISGLIEVEIFYESLDVEGGKETVSDVALATAQLGFEASVTEHVGGTLILLFEEGEEEGVIVDEGTIDYERGHWKARFGRQYLPFGVYPSHMISDPLTLELGETRETALLVGYGTDLFHVSAYAANGDVDVIDDNDVIDDWGVGLTLRPRDFLEFGASYSSDLADSDAELVELSTGNAGGWSAYGIGSFGAFEVSGEILGATEDLATIDPDVNGTSPLAWNIEAAWHVRENVELAARLEGSDEFAGQPERQYGACVSWGPWESVSISLEYLRGEFGDGEGDRNLFTTQMAMEF
jgi:hypothetical protein